MDACPLPARKPSPRLRDFDYATPGAYFITTCAFRRRTLFGRVVGANVLPSAIGIVVQQHWCRIPERFPGIELGPWVLMPNHFHGILELRPGSRANVSSIIQWWKSITTHACHRLDSQPGPRIWQRGFHDHVIRSEATYRLVAEYIQNNPLQWHLDRYHT